MSKIEWTGKTWNPYIGCDKVSPGCENCYAIRMGYRLAHMPHTKAIYGPALYKTVGGKLNWSGKIMENYPQMDKPLRTKKPTTFFVNSMSDLFHKDVTFQMIDDVYEVMNACPHHTFQLLTKRSKRLVEYYDWKKAGNGYKYENWPLQNVWVGVSVENQKYADERIPDLCQVPAAVRFLSCEPLLGYVKIGLMGTAPKDWGYGYTLIGNLINWVITGGESGPNSRPMHPDWVRQLRDECEDAKVPFFFKQWGEFADGSDARLGEERNFVVMNNGDHAAAESPRLKSEYGSKWHIMLPTMMRKVGKDKSGNKIDDKQYLQMPNQ